MSLNTVQNGKGDAPRHDPVKYRAGFDEIDWGRPKPEPRTLDRLRMWIEEAKMIRSRHDGVHSTASWLSGLMATLELAETHGREPNWEGVEENMRKFRALDRGGGYRRA